MDIKKNKNTMEKPLFNKNTSNSAPQNQVPLNFNLVDSPYVECEKCQGKVFEEKNENMQNKR